MITEILHKEEFLKKMKKSLIYIGNHKDLSDLVKSIKDRRKNARM